MLLGICSIRGCTQAGTGRSQSFSGVGSSHHVVLNAGAAHSEQLDSFQGTGSCYDGVCGRNCWDDVLHHPASQLPRHSLQPVGVKLCCLDRILYRHHMEQDYTKECITSEIQTLEINIIYSQ